MTFGASRSLTEPAGWDPELTASPVQIDQKSVFPPVIIQALGQLHILPAVLLDQIHPAVLVPLDTLQPVAYVPVDISAEYLYESALKLGREFSWLRVYSICADFSDHKD